MAEYVHTWRAWQRCIACLLPSRTEDGRIVKALYDKYIVARYTEPQRYYHTMAHLEHMFALLAEYKTSKGGTEKHELLPRHADWSPLVIDLAVLFHDAVYDPRAHDNEAQSAQWVRCFLDDARAHCGRVEVAHSGLTTSDACIGLADESHTSLLWDDEAGAAVVTASVVSFIMHSANHLAASSAHEPSSIASREPDDDALHVFLDLDLAILGSTDADYARYTEAIRREYSFYPEDEYCRGRSDFLVRLQQHPRWYTTPYFHARLEEQARHNVADELLRLRARHGAG